MAVVEVDEALVVLVEVDETRSRSGIRLTERPLTSRF